MVRFTLRQSMLFDSLLVHYATMSAIWVSCEASSSGQANNCAPILLLTFVAGEAISQLRSNQILVNTKVIVFGVLEPGCLLGTKHADVVHSFQAR